MSDKEKLILKLLKNLNERDFNTLMYAEEAAERKELLHQLLQKDSRWVSVLPLLDEYLKAQYKAKPYFESRTSEAWDTLQVQLTQPIAAPWYKKIPQYTSRIAASLVLLCTATFLYSNYEPDQFTKSHAISTVWKTSGTGSDMIVLPDSSRVWLNKNSSIAYIRPHGSERRQVRITGEAYFEVKSSETNPFDVIHKQGMVTVTGTHFFTGNEQSSHKFYVDLIEGKVTFQTYGFMPKTAVLTPSHKLIYLPDTKNGIRLKPSGKAKYLWLRKAIICNRMPLPELINQMKAWYQTDIVLTDKASKNLHFSGTLSPESSLQSNLEKLSWTSKLKFIKKNNQYLIQSEY